MKRNFFKLLGLSLILCLPIFTFAKENFKENQDYVVMQIDKSLEQPQGQKVQVIEFFSYGCPACNRLEPLLEKWLAKKPAYVEFSRVPVVFEPGWDLYAKLYYLVHAYDDGENFDKKIFQAIHKQGQDLSQLDNLKSFLSNDHFPVKDIDSAFNSPSFAIELRKSDELMKAYQVMDIPSILVAGHFKTSASLTKGDDQKLLDVVTFLIHKASAEQHSKKV